MKQLYTQPTLSPKNYFAFQGRYILRFIIFTEAMHDLVFEKLRENITVTEELSTLHHFEEEK